MGAHSVRVALVLAFLLMAAPVAAAPGSEADEAAVTRVVTSDGELLLQTGLKIHPGDRFIDGENGVWSVTSLAGDRAVARQVARLVRPPGRRELSLLQSRAPRAAHALAGAALADVVIYHTHSDEAYRGGGITHVGAALAASLSARGLRVIHRQDFHGPHDAGAYVRSRRTAADVEESAAPAALFDIHRDTAPAAAYTLPGGSNPLARILIVVGRTNPDSEANLAFARLLKARADELTPGLIKGILLVQGSYNQDLSARSLLLEVGAKEMNLAEAEAGAAMLAVSLPAMLHDLDAPTALEQANAAAWRGAAQLVFAALFCLALWLLTVHRGWRPAVAWILGNRRERR